MATEEHKVVETHTTVTDDTDLKGHRSPRAYGYGYGSDPRRAVCTFLTVLLLLAAITALIVWLVYRPQRPQFTVVGAAVYGLNTTSTPLVTATMQFTVITRNPNERVSIYYDKISAFVVYKGQQITQPVIMLPFHQRKHSMVAFSPVMGGTAVPVTVEVANGLKMDQSYGVVALRLVLTGSLRYKAGAIKTGHYGYFVNCDVLMGLKKGAVGQVPLLGSAPCKVHT